MDSGGQPPPAGNASSPRAVNGRAAIISSIKEIKYRGIRFFPHVSVLKNLLKIFAKAVS
jgi:hypothetical protein